jgi:hypothetical protein
MDSSEVASIQYTFWSAPVILQASFDSSGTRIMITFDQATNRAEMIAGEENCTDLLWNCAVLMGVRSRCVWISDDQLAVYLGPDATVTPGSLIRISVGSGLRSINGISGLSFASTVVTAPFRVAPSVLVQGVETIDACSDLYVYATVASPRTPLAYSWSCLNDPEFDSYLTFVSGPVLKLASGTPQMKILNKSYSIAFAATDFLGSVSQQVLINIFKQSTPTPQIQFVPPYLTTTRDSSVLIRGQAVFSSCPVDQKELNFTWRLVQGSGDFPQSALDLSIPQLYLPPNSLTAGVTYILGLRVSVPGDASMTSEGMFVMQVVYHPLIAKINGGTSLLVSFMASFSISASSSYDPDDDGLRSTGRNLSESLQFSWSCLVSDGSSRSKTCRNQNGVLLSFPASPTLLIPPFLLAPLDSPYIFAVTVSKPGRSSGTASMPVYVVLDQIPVITMNTACVRAEYDHRSCCVAPSGAVLSNTDSHIVFTAFSSVPSTEFYWHLEPLTFALDGVSAPLGNRSALFVVQGSMKNFVPGNHYTVYVLGLLNGSDAVGKAEQALIINSPPQGGSFSACLIPGEENEGGECITSGTAVIDIFRLVCASWTDPEGGSLLQYRFGYKNENGENASNESVWFDWTPDSMKEMSFPSGHIFVMAQIRDECGGQSDTLEASLILSGASDGIGKVGRRLLAAANFWDIARAKVQGALQTFRPDNVNQLVSSMSAEISRQQLSSTNPFQLRESLILSLRTATGQVSSLLNYSSIL